VAFVVEQAATWSKKSEAEINALREVLISCFAPLSDEESNGLCDLLEARLAQEKRPGESWYGD
jgi:hypothetical protein